MNEAPTLNGQTVADGIVTLPAANDESLVLAALLESPTFGERYASLLDATMFNQPIQRALARHALEQIRTDGCASWQLVVQDVADEGDYAESELAGEVLAVLEWHPGAVPGDRVAAMAASRMLARHSKRELTDRLQSIASAAANEDTAETIAALQSAIDAHSRHKPTATSRLADHLGADPADDADEIIRTGVEFIDDALPGGGLVAGEKLIISAEPGAGKTALMLQLALSAIDANNDLSVVWGLGEMTERAIRNRSLQCLSGLTLGVLRRPWGHLSPVQEQAKRQAIDALRAIGERFHILPAPLTPSRITAAVNATGARLLVVDYLQLCQPDKPGQSRRDDVDNVLHALCRLAQSHGLAVLIISNQAKGSGAARDIFSAFKESSELAFAADLAFVGEWIGVDADAVQRGEIPDVVDVRWRCLKARGGPQRPILTRFNRPTQRFEGIWE